MNYKPNVKQVKAIAKKVVTQQEEEKQYVVKQLTAYTWLGAAGTINTPLLLTGLTQGTASGQVVGSQMTLKSITITYKLYNDVSRDENVAIDWFICYLPYQATPYTEAQVFEQGYGFGSSSSTDPVDLHFVQVVGRRHVINLTEPSINTSAMRYGMYKQTIRKKKWFQDGSIYSKEGKDLYFVAKVVTPQTGSGAFAYLEVTADVRYTDA